MSSNYKFQFTKDASKILSKLDKTLARRIIQAIESLSSDPYGHPQTKQMKGMKAAFTD